jgi:ABC-type glycerol-3-phosphate transport system permease component
MPEHVMRNLERTGLQITAVVGALLYLFPLYWMVVTGLKSESEIAAWPPTLWPGNLDLNIWIAGWTRFNFSLFLFNTTVIAVATTILCVFVNSLAAFGFAKYRFKAREPLFFCFLATLMIPGQVTMIPLFLIMRDLGWLNTHWSVVAPNIATAFAVFFLRQYLQTIPSELVDAARIDGCSDFGIYWRIILPLAVPALIVLGILTFIQSWNAFLWPLIMLTSQDKFTIPIGLSYYKTEFFTAFNYQMAVVTISLIPILVLYLLFQRHIVRGIATSGLKG